jgi:hypothetical protein
MFVHGKSKTDVCRSSIHHVRIRNCKLTDKLRLFAREQPAPPYEVCLLTLKEMFSPDRRLYPP